MEESLSNQSHACETFSVLDLQTLQKARLIHIAKSLPNLMIISLIFSFKWSQCSKRWVTTSEVNVFEY